MTNKFIEDIPQSHQEILSVLHYYLLFSLSHQLTKILYKSYFTKSDTREVMWQREIHNKTVVTAMYPKNIETS